MLGPDEGVGKESGWGEERKEEGGREREKVRRGEERR